MEVINQHFGGPSSKNWFIHPTNPNHSIINSLVFLHFPFTNHQLIERSNVWGAPEGGHIGRQGDLIDDVAWSQDLSFDAVVPMIRRLSGEEALRPPGCDDGATKGDGSSIWDLYSRWI